jgi:hypothetical protein
VFSLKLKPLLCASNTIAQKKTKNKKTKTRAGYLVDFSDAAIFSLSLIITIT